VSPFTFVSGSTTDINYLNGNVVLSGNLILGNIISNASAGGNLVMIGNVLHQGNVFITGNTVVSSFQERISSTTVAVSGTNPPSGTLVYNSSGGGTIYQVTGTFTSNYTLNLTNLPSITDATKTYVVTVTNNTTSANYVCNSVTVSTTSTVGTAATIYFNGSNTFAYSTSVRYSTQQFALVYSGSSLIVLTTYNQYFDK
jgi:hypothetical protein